MTQILVAPHPMLYQVADEATFGSDVSDIIATMWDALLTAGGYGLAAPQIGVSTRIIAVNYGQRYTILNPVVTPDTRLRPKTFEEGCLSVPDRRVQTRRYRKVQVTGFTPDWRPFRLSAKGYLAAVYQHEVDHLNGVLIGD